MKKTLFLFLLLTSFLSFSQSKSFEITGKLISKNDSIPVESATVYLQRVKDSTLITYTISDSKGEFVLENKTSDKNAILFVSYIGYKTYTKKIKLDKQLIALGNIKLQENTNTLDEVVIRAQVPPITIKKDTLEFNVKSFKTKKDANVEDLLKKLPGVEVGQDGKIKINGKEVNKILVNGKPFFSNDPTIATKNLSKDIIEKIQVSDTKTDEEAFTGETGDQTNKTVNLVIKKENNKGVFGRLAAGGGTDKRYEFAGMFNHFDNDLRLSVLTGGNNINTPGFSYGEIDKMYGGSSYNINRQLFNYGTNGIIVSKNLGLNYVDDWGKKADIATNYFGSNSDNENVLKSNKEYIIPNNRYFTNLNATTKNHTEKHSTETKFKIKIDSTLLITLDPQFRHTKTNRTYNSNETAFDTNNVLINDASTNTLNKSTNNYFSNNINVTKRLGKNNSFIKFDVYNRFVNDESENKINNTVDIYGDNPETITRNQLREGNNKDNTLVLATTYRIPLKQKIWSLDLGLGYRKNIQKNIQNSYDFNETINDYESEINEQLSSDFKYDNITTTPSVNVSYRKKKWSSSIKAEYILRTLKSTDYLRPNFNLKRNFNAAQINYRLNYRSPKNSLGVGYYLRNEVPNLNQLQPFENISNPTNIITGNPNLTPANNHNLYLYYNKNNFQKGVLFYSYINTSFLNNNVVSKSTIDENLIRNTTYENVNGQYRLNATFGLQKKIKLDSVKSIRIGAGIRSSLNRNINFSTGIDENNNVQYSGITKSLMPNIGASYTWNDVTEIGVNYDLSYTQNSYNTSLYNNQNFISHNFLISTTNNFSKKFDFRNEVRFNYNPNIADGFKKSAWFWNATLDYTIIKNTATLSLKAYDLLNQNINARRINNQNYIEDRQSTVLQQYFMLSFSWKFNTLGKKGEIRNDRRYIIR